MRFHYIFTTTTPGNRKLDHARNRRSEFIFKDIRGIEVIVQETDLQLE